MVNEAAVFVGQTHTARHAIQSCSLARMVWMKNLWGCAGLVCAWLLWLCHEVGVYWLKVCEGRAACPMMRMYWKTGWW